jgi:hypothetical protein
MLVEMEIFQQDIRIEFTGVENYKGRADQIEAVMDCISVGNYKDMCQKVLFVISGGSVRKHSPRNGARNPFLGLFLYCSKSPKSIIEIVEIKIKYFQNNS